MANGLHSHRIRVRYADTDASGIAHHSAYVIWLEEARVAVLRDNGLPYHELVARGITMPVIDLHVRYRRSAVFDDLLEVHSWVAALSEVRIRLAYALYRVEHAGKPQPPLLLVEAETEHPFLDSSGKIVRLRSLPDLNAKFRDLAQQLPNPEAAR